MLKITGVKLQLLYDREMLDMFEEGIRGGILMISKRYARANNKYMGKDFDTSKPSKFIIYLDANNLYGFAMQKHLPFKNFKKMKNPELGYRNGVPCILVVDLEIPEHLHDCFNDYPLAPERLYGNGAERLIPNLMNKKNYVLYYKNLKLYEELRLKITKFHRGISFDEKPFMKDYIDLNTKLRANANNDFEKDFFKLMNNSVFGKTMENIRNRINFKLLTKRKNALNFAAKPNFQREVIFDEDLIGIHMMKKSLTFNKPIYCGMSILELSKEQNSNVRRVSLQIHQTKKRRKSKTSFH